jgi:hypothetical protein
LPSSSADAGWACAGSATAGAGSAAACAGSDAGAACASGAACSACCGASATGCACCASGAGDSSDWVGVVSSVFIAPRAYCARLPRGARRQGYAWASPSFLGWCRRVRPLGAANLILPRWITRERTFPGRTSPATGRNCASDAAIDRARWSGAQGARARRAVGNRAGTGGRRAYEDGGDGNVGASRYRKLPDTRNPAALADALAPTVTVASGRLVISSGMPAPSPAMASPHVT